MAFFSIVLSGDIMNLVWKETLYSIILIFLIIIISSFFINILSYFDIISLNVIKYLKILFLILSFFLGGIYMGKNSPNKGYMYGLRLSLLVIIIFLFLGIIFNNLSFTRIIYYLIATFCITFGSMIGINKKTDK